MPRFKKESFCVKNIAGQELILAVEILISADGKFYANLPDIYFDAFADKAALPIPVAGKFKVLAPAYEDLRSIIVSGLRKYMEPEIIKAPVIRYNIESHVSFATDGQGNIYPNAGYDGAGWPSDELNKLYGGHHAGNAPVGGYSIRVAARAMMRIECRHGDNVKVTYENYYAGGSHLRHENPAEILNGWTSMDLGRNPKEIPYSDKAAMFFHGLLLGVARLNQQVQMATFDQGNLLDLIEGHGNKRLPLLGVE